MRKMILTLSFLLPASSAFAAIGNIDVAKLKGKYTFDILKNKKVFALVRNTLTVTYVGATNVKLREAMMRAFEESLAVATPSVMVDGRYLVATGCEAHNCGMGNRAMFVLDAQNPAALLIVRKSVEDIVGKMVKEASDVVVNGEWAVTSGSEIRQFPAGLKGAIADL